MWQIYIRRSTFITLLKHYYYFALKQLVIEKWRISSDEGKKSVYLNFMKNICLRMKTAKVYMETPH